MKTQDLPQDLLAELSRIGIDPDSVVVDYGIITDAYGPEDSVEEWHNQIGKPPELEDQ
jgi:hypothetical protein